MILTDFHFALSGFSSDSTALLISQSTAFAFSVFIYLTLFKVTFLLLVALKFASGSIKLILLILSVWRLSEIFTRLRISKHLEHNPTKRNFVKCKRRSYCLLVISIQQSF